MGDRHWRCRLLGCLAAGGAAAALMEACWREHYGRWSCVRWSAFTLPDLLDIARCGCGTRARSRPCGVLPAAACPPHGCMHARSRSRRAGAANAQPTHGAAAIAHSACCQCLHGVCWAKSLRFYPTWHCFPEILACACRALLHRQVASLEPCCRPAQVCRWCGSVGCVPAAGGGLEWVG